LQGELTVLDTNVVTDRTSRQYRLHMATFMVWCQWEGADWTTALQLDAVLAVFFVHLFLDGYDVASGRGTVTALRHFLPGLLGGGLPMPRSSRALVGWRKLAPPRMRLPLPRAAMGAVVGYLLHYGLVGMAIFVALVFDAYLRPSEGYRLTGDCLVPPTSGAGPAHRHWGLIINSGDVGVLGKTGMTDESVVIDSPHLWDALAALKSARPGATCLWTFSPEQMRQHFKEAFDELGLWEEDPSMYRLRHGGASHDLLTQRRSWVDTQERGRWLTAASLRRYGKRTRLQQRINLMDPALRNFGETILDHFPALLCRAAVTGRCAVPIPPPRPGRRAPLKTPPELTRRWTFT